MRLRRAHERIDRGPRRSRRPAREAQSACDSASVITRPALIFVFVFIATLSCGRPSRRALVFCSPDAAPRGRAKPASLRRCLAMDARAEQRLLTARASPWAAVARLAHRATRTALDFAQHAGCLTRPRRGDHRPDETTTRSSAMTARPSMTFDHDAREPADPKPAPTPRLSRSLRVRSNVRAGTGTIIREYEHPLVLSASARRRARPCRGCERRSCWRDTRTPRRASAATRSSVTPASAFARRGGTAPTRSSSPGSTRAVSAP